MKENNMYVYMKKIYIYVYKTKDYYYAEYITLKPLTKQ